MRRLQEFGFEQSSYERPNQKWICGRACEGKCCLAGPDAKGNCNASAECRPLRKGDRWQCARPAFLGGPCADGPLPDGKCCRAIPKCTPIRSLRSWRGIAVSLVVAITLGFLLLAFGSRRGSQVLSPGELTFSHSFMGDDCTSCHGAAGGRPAAWGAVTAGSIGAHDNSALCLNCHSVGAAPLQPHSLSSAQLQSLNRSLVNRDGSGKPPLTLALASFVSHPNPHGEEGAAGLACASCHKEHRGKDADLRKLSNDQCQNCHATQFKNFASGHPPFSHYPTTRRTRIIFDHLSHLNTHFKDASVAKFAPGSCLDCHQTDLRGQTMVVKSFEAACASCHDDQIKGKSAVKTGIPFINIPRMDDRALSGEFSIGEWPEDADQPITPFLRFLLSSDPAMRDSLAKLKGTDLSNLPKTNAVILKAAQTVAWGVKSLILDLETQGQPEMVKRAASSLNRTLSDHEIEGLVAFLGTESLRAAFQSAFPNLQKELLDYRKNSKPAATKLVSSPELAAPGPIKPPPADVQVGQGGWYSADGSFTLSYHPRGHADRFLSSWMSLTVDASKTTDPASASALFNDLSAPKAVGLCAKCHSIDDAPVKLVNWMPLEPDQTEHGFTRFAHSPHLSLLDNRGCLTCHSWATSDGTGKDSYAAAFDPGQRDPSIFHSNFQTIDKSRCASCHQPHQVREDCLLCHNYHIGNFKPVVAHAKFIPATPARIAK